MKLSLLLFKKNKKKREREREEKNVDESVNDSHNKRV